MCNCTSCITEKRNFHFPCFSSRDSSNFSFSSPNRLFDTNEDLSERVLSLHPIFVAFIPKPTAKAKAKEKNGKRNNYSLFLQTKVNQMEKVRREREKNKEEITTNHDLKKYEKLIVQQNIPSSKIHTHILPDEQKF